MTKIGKVYSEILSIIGVDRKERLRSRGSRVLPLKLTSNTQPGRSLTSSMEETPADIKTHLLNDANLSVQILKS